ncbi:Smr/MutS family protein [Galbibacter sp.]|jgi:DNA-nicking Smr family endonuclease|uniref:Smr/MutS family protein n=1 Tax=Galbibacter sp. TaxID=2918471 RepID=UPI003A90CFB4
MSKFEVGVRVEVLDDAIKGYILKLGDRSATVRTTDGFDMEFMFDELVVINDDSSLKVSNIDVYHALSEKESKIKKRSFVKKKKEKQVPAMEVDLHIEKLTAKSKSMTNFDILNLQLNTARGQLEFAISKRIQRVVFIHGMGEGVLKSELHFLFSRYDCISYYDANYREYGLGATEVYIHQSAL